MKADSPIVREVRERALQISQRFGHDLKAYAAYLKRIEEQHRDRVVSRITVVPAAPKQPPPASGA
ncbi:MAG: hypothetical protein C4547_03380 [Phycisphaerales bacterium]|nr:MAG: hypothetical protein C4547_03380 [Phycisphaerales bacterium]